MAPNILESINQSIDDQLLRKIAFQLCEAATNTSMAFHGSLHVLLAQLDIQARSPEAAEQITEALRGFDAGILGSLEEIVFGGELDNLAQIGAALIETVFGEERARVIHTLSRYADIRQHPCTTLVGLAAPILFGALGQAQAEAELDAEGVASLLEAQRPHLQREARRDLLEVLNLDELIPPAPVDEREPPMREEDTTEVEDEDEKPAPTVAILEEPTADKTTNWPRLAIAVCVTLAVAGYSSWQFRPAGRQVAAAEETATTTHPAALETSLQPKPQQQQQQQHEERIEEQATIAAEKGTPSRENVSPAITIAAAASKADLPLRGDALPPATVELAPLELNQVHTPEPAVVEVEAEQVAIVSEGNLQTAPLEVDQPAPTLPEVVRHAEPAPPVVDLPAPPEPIRLAAAPTPPIVQPAPVVDAPSGAPAAAPAEPLPPQPTTATQTTKQTPPASPSIERPARPHRVQNKAMVRLHRRVSGESVPTRPELNSFYRRPPAQNWTHFRRSRPLN